MVLKVYLIPGRIGIWKCWFLRRGKTGVPGEKPLGAKKRTNNKLNPHMASMQGFEPGPHWWEATALTTAPSLAPPPFLLHSVVHVQMNEILLIYLLWFNFVLGLNFLLFQTHYHTSYLKTKKNKFKSRTKLDHNIFFIKYIFYIHCHFICISIQIIIHEQSL